MRLATAVQQVNQNQKMKLKDPASISFGTQPGAYGGNRPFHPSVLYVYLSAPHIVFMAFVCSLASPSWEAVFDLPPKACTLVFVTSSGYLRADAGGGQAERGRGDGMVVELRRPEIRQTSSATFLLAHAGTIFQAGTHMIEVETSEPMHAAEASTSATAAIVPGCTPRSAHRQAAQGTEGRPSVACGAGRWTVAGLRFFSRFSRVGYLYLISLINYWGRCDQNIDV